MNLNNINFKKPNSLGVSMQFVALWAGELDRAELIQLCAGAMGVCSQIEGIPHYRPSQGKPLDYGFAALEAFLNAGVQPANIFERGKECLLLMSSALPSEQEVEDTANF
tara:strand:+ start:699 stop:1025 length:327 start_codon:yes stop_codon:yes gene_type:complete